MLDISIQNERTVGVRVLFMGPVCVLFPAGNGREGGRARVPCGPWDRRQDRATQAPPHPPLWQVRAKLEGGQRREIGCGSREEVSRNAANASPWQSSR